MKEPDFFINKAQSLIDDLHNIDMFELNEIDSKKYEHDLLVSTNIFLVDDFNSEEDKEEDIIYLGAVNDMKRNIDFFDGIIFEIRLLLKEFDNDLFYEKYNNFLNDNNSRIYNVSPRINITEYNKSLDILEKFILFINEYRK